MFVGKFTFPLQVVGIETQQTIQITFFSKSFRNPKETAVSGVHRKYHIFWDARNHYFFAFQK